MRTSSRIAAYALIVAIPALMTCALAAALFKASLLDYFPAVSDELAYYQQIAAFVRAGFDGGYFTVYETPAPLAFSHFGPHGPAFPVIYGLVGRVIGWSIESGPLFNLGVLAIATTLFLWMTQGDARRIATVGLVFITSWWVILMVSITMQESLNQAFAIVAAAGAVRLMDFSGPRRGLLCASLLIVLAAAALLRPTNWIPCVPLLLVGLRRFSWGAAAAVIASLAFPLLWAAFRLVSAPVPGRPLELGTAPPADAIRTLASHAGAQLSVNISSVFDPGSFVAQPFAHYAVYEIAAIAAVSGWFVARAVRRTAAARQHGRTRWSELWEGFGFRVDVLNAVALGIALVAFLGFYYDDQASMSRVMAPFLLFSQLVLAATGWRPRLLAVLILASLAVAPSFVRTFAAWRSDLFTYDRARFAIFRHEVAPLIAFREGQSPWCNTLLTMSYDREIVGVPAGIGLSVAKPGVPDAPVRSKYLLLTGNGPEWYRSKADLHLLGSTVLGDVYLNRDAACR